MNPTDKYTKIIEWSEQDQCFIGSCPELVYGGCHGDDPRKVFDQLCLIVDEILDLYRQDGRILPTPMTNKEFVNALQKIA